MMRRSLVALAVMTLASVGRAERVVSIRYQSLPAGDYSLRGALIDAEGHERAVVEKQITVMTSGGEH
jgi:hypothetical protein